MTANHQKIPQQALDQEFQSSVRAACVSLAEACYQRVMRNPERGLRLLSDIAMVLDCKLSVELQPSNRKDAP